MKTIATTITRPKNILARLVIFAREYFRNCRQRKGAEDRPENRAGTAEYGHDDHSHVERNIEGAARVKVGDPISMNAASNRRENTAQRESQHLMQGRVDAHDRRRRFIFPDRDQSETEAAARDPGDRKRRDYDQRQ